MKKKILLIEDNPDMRENTAEILELSGYVVITAANGKEGVELAKQTSPDLIICDIMMPVLDGYGVLHVLSKEPDTSKIPFIFLTAKAEKSDYRKGMIMGADDYLTKPFDDVELLDAIEARLKKSEMMKKEYEKGAEGFNQFINEAKTFEEFKNLGKDRQHREFRKKDFLFVEGSYPNSLYLITKGKVKTFKTNEEGKELITGVHTEGEFLGHIALLEDRKFTETAEALEETEIALIPRDEFQSLIYNNKEIANKFINILSRNVMDNEERLLKLAYNSVRKRVAEALVMLHDRYNKDNAGTVISVNREDLSNIVGTSTESAIRTLADFKEEGLIEIKKGDIKIINLEKLRKMRN
jgi:CRP/FNR family transcriptional regulator, polysaccharide utilization system transcription regulator